MDETPLHKTPPWDAAGAGFGSPVPMARPVTIDLGQLVPYARPARQTPPMPLRPLRAFFEVLLLVPAALLGSLLAGLASLPMPLEDPRWVNILGSYSMGMLSLLVIAAILRIDRHRAGSIGLTRERLIGDINLGVLAYGLSMAAIFSFVVFLALLFPHWFTGTPTAQKAIEEAFPRMELTVAVPTMLFVAFWEEVAFRGFLLTRLHALLKRWWLSVLVGAVLFGVVHAYQGPVAVLQVTLLGLILGGLFAWRKSLVPGIAFHFVHNMVMLLILQAVSQTWQ